jgi:hypothetical protein
MAPKDVTELLTEYDEITITLSPEPGLFSVSVPRLGTTTISALSELNFALANPNRWRPDDRLRQELRGIIIKASPDVDLYGRWSTNVDNFVAIGTRSEFLSDGVNPSRMARADLYGTSAQNPDAPDAPGEPRYLGWETNNFLVHEQTNAPSNGAGMLPRTQLEAFMRAQLAGDDAAAGSLLLPLPDNDD